LTEGLPFSTVRPVKLSASALIFALGSLFLAGVQGQDASAKNAVVPSNPAFFGEGLELDVFGAAGMPEKGSSAAGGGVGMAYYFTPRVGIDASYTVLAFDDEVHTVSADMVLRYPVSQAGVAPYVVLGAGVVSDGEADALYRLGGGLDVRFQPDGMGIFADGIYNWVVGENNFTIARLGVRIPF